MKTLFYMTAPWCQPCKAMKPIAKELAKRYNASFIEVNVDEQQPILPEITGIPTAVIYGPESGEPEAILTPQMLNPVSLAKALM